jgi:hypothetical protein
MSQASRGALKRIAGNDARKVDGHCHGPAWGLLCTVTPVVTTRSSVTAHIRPSAQQVSARQLGRVHSTAWCPPGGESAPVPMVSPLLLGVRQQAEAPQMPTK